MSKDSISKAADAIKHVVDDTKDAVNETGHRAAADAEKARRDALGNEMTPGEKVSSIANEIKDRTQAKVDEAKRKLRDRS
jgi:uncharacterized Zn ribbon protein